MAILWISEPAAALFQRDGNTCHLVCQCHKASFTCEVVAPTAPPKREKKKKKKKS